MRAQGIKKYLRVSKIMGRKSTFSNAFASALAPFDEYSDEVVAEEIMDLGQDPQADLECVYCGAAAATWDHVFNRVLEGEFSGHGHRIRNLVPSCRTCNERKGKKHWRDFLEQLAPDSKEERIERMEQFLKCNDALPTTMEKMQNSAASELGRFLEVRAEVFQLLEEADELAEKIRSKVVGKDT